ncbi:MAG: hypothetical protein AB7I27_05840 [Bacteriovoracaceae bacterium]
MTRFSGNNVLIIDEDQSFTEKLAELLGKEGANCLVGTSLKSAKENLEKYSFDLVISNHYLSDGIIHQLIDWCKGQLDFMPLFVVLNEPSKCDRRFLVHNCITESLTKKDPKELLEQLAPLLFNVEDFKKDLHDYFEGNGVLIELLIQNKKYFVHPVEINFESIILDFDQEMDGHETAVLKVRVKESANRISNFIVLGTCQKVDDGLLFKVQRSYESTWAQLLFNLDERQCYISKFLKKAAGF